MLGINSESYVLNNVAKNINKQANYLSKIVNNDSVWRKLTSELSKLKLLTSIAEVDYTYDMMTYKFNDVKTAKEYFKNL
jgi:hypothetical protein